MITKTQKQQIDEYLHHQHPEFFEEPPIETTFGAIGSGLWVAFVAILCMLTGIMWFAFLLVFSVVPIIIADRSIQKNQIAYSTHATDIHH